MTTRNRPNYGIYYLALTIAGTIELPVVGTRLVMSGALQGATLTFLPGGTQELVGGSAVNALLNVQIGKNSRRRHTVHGRQQDSRRKQI